MTKHTIIIIDDRPELVEMTKRFLEQEGFIVRVIADPDQALALIRQKFDVSILLVDYYLGDLRGPAVIRQIRELNPDLPIIGFSCDDSKAPHNESIESGALMHLAKDTDEEMLLAVLHRQCREVERKTKTLTLPPPSINSERVRSLNMAGNSEYAAHLAEMIYKFGPNHHCVLILGKNGTGKEKVAEAIHRVSGRRGRFIAVNCGSFAKDLIAAELFGVEKGAFTGAGHNKAGKFRAAEGGTIFLDEIGEMPLELQPVLLRVLENREVTPVGSSQPVKVNARVVAATNAPLEEMVHSGRFREDLFYRLCILSITVKPLREHPEDIPALVEHLLAKENKAALEAGLTTEPKAILEAAVRVLSTREWPGNVRELANYIAKLFVLADGPKITEDTIRFMDALEDSKKPKATVNRIFDYFCWLRQVECDEARLIRAALLACHNNISHAADRLGISRGRLRGRIEALKIEFEGTNNPTQEISHEQSNDPIDDESRSHINVRAR